MTAQSTRALIDSALAEVSETRGITICAGAIADAGARFHTTYPNKSFLIVADERTFDVAGASVASSLREAGCHSEEPMVFPAEPDLRPDYQHVRHLRERMRATTLPIAVGSGTINDLTKRAAFEAGIPYVGVPTAASMDGYTASGAALISEGVKQTFECPAPELVVADLDILRNAPPAMTASGYGDLVGKVTAGADWLLADALGIEPVLPDIWRMVQGPLQDMIAEPERLFRGDADAIEQLFHGLVITGLAIQVAGSSRPASGSEHQFSHLWEMRDLEHDGAPVSHGMKVALGTIMSTALYERLLSRPMHRRGIDQAVSSWPSIDEMEARVRRSHDHPRIAEKALDESRAKYISPDGLHARLTLLRDRWPALCERLQAQLLPSDQLCNLLERAHCPTQPEHIGLSRAQAKESYFAAGHIRRRYTVYDLASEMGLLSETVEGLFGQGGYWDGTAS